MIIFEEESLVVQVDSQQKFVLIIGKRFYGHPFVNIAHFSELLRRKVIKTRTID